MSTLLTLVQQQSIKPISQNNTAKYEQLATEVQNKDLRDLLGIALYQDVVANPTSTQNLNLLNGASFVNSENYTISHQGLRFVLAYLNHVKYIGESFVNDTFTGFVQKNRPDSESMTEGAIKRLQQESKDIALSEWDIIKQYLDANYTIYTLWNSNNSKKIYRPKFTGLRNTQL
jgi:hypothetical protein